MSEERPPRFDRIRTRLGRVQEVLADVDPAHVLEERDRSDALEDVERRRLDAVKHEYWDGGRTSLP